MSLQEHFSGRGTPGLQLKAARLQFSESYRALQGLLLSAEPDERVVAKEAEDYFASAFVLF